MEEHKCDKCEKTFDSSDALNQHKEAKHKTGVVEKAKPATDKTKLLIYALILAVGAAAVYVLTSSVSSGPRIGSVGSTHEHVDFKVYIEGVPVDFAMPKYQLKAQYAHVEGGVGGVIHKHATGVTFRDFLKTVNIDIGKQCVRMDDGNNYCNEGGKTLKFYLNGKLSDKIETYELHDLDKALVSYGNETAEQVEGQLSTITDLARIESNKELPSDHKD
ncbi:MAG: C2H2-type zinc finger protein [Candidatus Aenigmarchaeota archaeon]|nr:C2H2-type zinc finger protein [Candidatus Aenigmarchaeota archaeon]